MSQDFIIDIAKIVLSSTLLTTLLNTIITGVRESKKEKKQEKTGLYKAVQLLLLGELKRQGKDHIKDGALTLEELNEFNEKYEVYKAMNGNGYAETVHKKVNSLQTQLED